MSALKLSLVLCAWVRRRQNIPRGLPLLLAGFDLSGTVVSDREKCSFSSTHYKDDSTSMFSFIACWSGKQSWPSLSHIASASPAWMTHQLHQGMYLFCRGKGNRLRQRCTVMQVCKWDSTLGTAAEETQGTSPGQGNDSIQLSSIKRKSKLHM